MHCKSINLYKEDLYRKMLVFRVDTKFRGIIKENRFVLLKLIIASCTLFFVDIFEFYIFDGIESP